MTEQSILKDEANSILEELALLPALGEFGEAQVVGSVALDLIVKLDIDLHLLIEAQDLMPTAHTVTEYLLAQDKVREVRVTDWREGGGIKLGVDAYPAASGDWSIDIWITNERGTTAFDIVQRFKEGLGEEERRAILAIKRYFHQQGKLRDGLSLRIYKAVMEEGVRTVEEFIGD